MCSPGRRPRANHMGQCGHKFRRSRQITRSRIHPLAFAKTRRWRIQARTPRSHGARRLHPAPRLLLGGHLRRNTGRRSIGRDRHRHLRMATIVRTAPTPTARSTYGGRLLRTRSRSGLIRRRHRLLQAIQQRGHRGPRVHPGPNHRHRRIRRRARTVRRNRPRRGPSLSCAEGLRTRMTSRLHRCMRGNSSRTSRAR